MTENHPARDWFHIDYTPDAAPGLPPLIQADHVMRYRDDDGTWLVALWAARAPPPKQPLCASSVSPPRTSPR